MSATSEKSSAPVVNESVVRNSDDRAWPTTSVTTIRPISSPSQLPAKSRRREPAPAAAVVSGAGAVADVGADSASTAGGPLPQGRGAAQAHEAGGRGGGEQNGGPRGPPPQSLGPP